MSLNYNIAPIFPIGIYLTQVPQEILRISENYLNNEDINNLDIKKDFGTRSVSTYILEKPEYYPLKNYILNHATNYLENILCYNYTHYKFTQSWISIKHPNESHYPHWHPHSLISGVMFYGKSEKDSSSLTFHREDKMAVSFNTNKIKNLSNSNSFSSNYCNFSFSPSDLILFPSILKHSVDENITSTPRKSLAFNIVPRDGFGDHDSLTELKF